MRGHEHATVSTLRHSPPIRAMRASSQVSRAAGASARSWADAPPGESWKRRLLLLFAYHHMHINRTTCVRTIIWSLCIVHNDVICV